MQKKSYCTKPCLIRQQKVLPMPTSDNPIAKPQPLSNDVLEAYCAMADSIAKTTHYAVSLYDTAVQKYIHISESTNWIRTRYKEMALQHQSELHTKSIPYKEMQMLNMAHKSLVPIVDRIDIKERKKIYLIQNNHYTIHEQKNVLCSKKISALTFNSDGTPRIVMTLYLFTNQQEGLFCLLNNTLKKEYHIYNFLRNRWERHSYTQLSHNEFQMLMLSNSGKSISDIATIMHKSTDTVKGYRKAVFDKMNVTNIQGAIVRALDYKLFAYPSNDSQ